MKRIYKLILASGILAILGVSILSWSIATIAQQSPPPAAAGAVVSPNPAPSSSGLAGLIAAHGGLLASALLLVGSLNVLLSAVRQVLCNYDGIPPGGQIPANLTGLTTINKWCVWLGTAIDWFQGNVQH